MTHARLPNLTLFLRGVTMDVLERLTLPKSFLCRFDVQATLYPQSITQNKTKQEK